MRSPRLPSPPSQAPAMAGLQESESLPLTDTQRSLILLPGRKRRAKILPHRVPYKKPWSSHQEGRKKGQRQHAGGGETERTAETRTQGQKTKNREKPRKQRKKPEEDERRIKQKQKSGAGAEERCPKPVLLLVFASSSACRRGKFFVPSLAF